MHTDIQNIRKTNLRKIINERFKGSINAFAKYIKRPSGFFYDAFANKRPLGERVMRSIEIELGLIPHELDRHTAESFQEKKFELINVYSLKLSAGSGNEISDEEIIDQSPIHISLMVKNGWRKEKLCCFNIDGNSMEPTLHDGSRVLINTAAREIVDNKIYAIRRSNEVFIKRLYKIFGENKIIAKSDNPLYPEFHINLSEDNHDFKIVGMAILRLEEPL